MANEVSPRGLVARLLSNAFRGFGDGQQSSVGGPRFSPYGEQAVLVAGSPKQIAGDEGSYFCASLGPGATALQLGLSASFSATAPALVLINTGASGNSPNCILDRVHMVVSGAPTSATGWNFSTVIDNVNRAPTTTVNIGGTPATATAYPPTVNCTNMNNGQGGVGKWYFPLSIAAGAPPAAPVASGSARTLIGNGVFRSQIPVIGDEYTLQFGALDEPAGYAVTAAPAGYSRITIGHPPVSIGPGQAFLLYMWGPSNATAGIILSQLDVGHIER